MIFIVITHLLNSMLDFLYSIQTLSWIFLFKSFGLHWHDISTLIHHNLMTPFYWLKSPSIYVLILFFAFSTFRSTLPRLRVDLLLDLFWKYVLVYGFCVLLILLICWDV